MDEQTLPRIIPRNEHPLSRQHIDPDALKILYRLQQHGFVAYLVGGCVRDLLLGKSPKDFDVATNAHPQQIRELFGNSRLIGRRFRLAHIYFKGGKFIEVSTFRRRSEFENSADQKHPQAENTFGTPAEDAWRRDITINGIFYNIADFSLVDYVGGLEDLRRGVIRCLGDPQEKFTSDPVRMIRVIRHAARTGFAIEEKTYRALITHAEKISRCSAARVRDEFIRELREGSARKSMELMIESRILFIFFPSFLHPLREGERKEYFLNLLAALDSPGITRETPAEEFCLALFLWPFLDFFSPLEDSLSGRRGQAIFQHKVREWVTATLLPMQFPRHLKEAVIHLLATQKIFREFLPDRQLPRRFQRKPYFFPAFRLYEMGSRVRGETPAVLSFFTERKRAGLKKRKKRRQRKSSSPAFKSPRVHPLEEKLGISK